ncbi:hypothetical protein [Lentzea flaviverrucosa]|uniref:Uncharacterized protein n=1 Tax=Lentzea flaviverrucosa TaxID=200379 RepID=A0A1H9CE57_9PSEU|nr:hypothetical protein [Lentzea flaviverrucosa]RDI24520.1 hypothetical protein DFR72_109100 [Lentzea flaviverrucosa]SEP99287.1 hypothetical protein SAMN05216195_101755 [Lentzea flaviverrucosa]
MTDDSKRRVTIDGMSWQFPPADAAKVIAEIEGAMTNGTVARLSLFDDDGAATVFFNGRLVSSVVVDNGNGPRPTEISGRAGGGQPRETTDLPH